jgi:hypothetical protein
VKNANWHPNNTDLETACGEQNSISVREVLDVALRKVILGGEPGARTVTVPPHDLINAPQGAGRRLRCLWGPAFRRGSQGQGAATPRHHGRRCLIGS